MSKKYIEFNGITFGGKSWIDKQDGAGRIYTPYIITEFHPNEVNTTYQQDDFITDGALFSNFRYNARIVSLRGYILPRKDDKIEELRQQLYTKLNGKKNTKLVYFDGRKKFFCMAFADAPVCANTVKNSVEFNINFTVPDFFWYDSEQTVVAVAERKNLIKSPFALPMMFSQRISRVTIKNENEFGIYPKITFVTEAGSVYIINHTTGEQIVLSGLSVEDGMEIVIDCKELTATVNGENIINNFNDFSDFAIVPGLNDLECIDSNENRETVIALKYYKPYVGI